MSGVAYWLLKTDPGEYSFAELERAGRVAWDGVNNNLALMHLREMRRGDRALIYHTGREKAIVGEAWVVSDPFPDPALDDPRRVVVDIEALAPWPRPVTLLQIKRDRAFADFGLVRISRLSVMPVPYPLWRRLMRMAAQQTRQTN